MKKIWKRIDWIVLTALGSAVFALGFSLFLEPYNINAGGISGLAQAIAHIVGLQNVGVLSVILNLPLFLIGGYRVGKRFFAGSLLGMLVSGFLIDVFALIPMESQDTLVSGIYGGLLCGLGIGIVFTAGTSTGGSDILVRLLKLRYRNVPIGIISTAFDAVVVVLTGIRLSALVSTTQDIVIVSKISDVISGILASKGRCQKCPRRNL